MRNVPPSLQQPALLGISRKDKLGERLQASSERCIPCLGYTLSVYGFEVNEHRLPKRERASADFTHSIVVYHPVMMR